MSSAYSSLVALFYDKFVENDAYDIEFIKTQIRNKKKHVLELAVGTGRILIPLLQDGYIADGLDNSSAMLAVARRKLKNLKLNCTLYSDDMTNFKLQKKYDFIFIAAGSFMIVDFEKGIQTLKCIKHNLTGKGAVLLDMFIPQDDIKKQKSASMKTIRDVSTGNERCLVYETFTIDPGNQVKHGKYRYEHYCNNKLKSVETNELNIRWYYEEEITSILKSLGFSRAAIINTSPTYIKNEFFTVIASK